jgi:hypothetical protein
MLILLAALPVLYWQAGPDTTPLLKQAGITQIAVPLSNLSLWKNVRDLRVEGVNLQESMQLPPPGVAFRMNVASASRVPWVNSNGWRLMRWPQRHFHYNVDANTAPLAAAEAFCYNTLAVLQTDQNGLQPLATMLHFLSTLPPDAGDPVADIGFIDDGSPVDAEVMNLMVRDNLLFRILRSPEPGYKLIVQVGSDEYSKEEAKNPDLLVHKIRYNLTDARRTIRIFGTSVVLARVTAHGQHTRIQLLNYGASRGMQVGAFRVHILGRYQKAQLRSYGDADLKLADYEIGSNETEFTIPELKTYAVVDLTRSL